MVKKNNIKKLYNHNCYLLLSGGQDSFACFLWAKKKFKNIYPLTINYGQKHSKEIFYAKKITKKFSLPYKEIKITNLLKNFSHSSLLNPQIKINSAHQIAKNLPSSFVANRNSIFLTLLSNYAFSNGEQEIHLVTGACQTDYSGYPDCRNSFIQAKAIELSFSLDREVNIHTPLMWKNKADTFEIAHQSGFLKEMLTLTLTCYNGNTIKNKWGMGCDDCPSCLLRKKGFFEFSKRKR